MKFISLKTKDGLNKGKISFYCKALEISRQGFYKYQENKDKPWKYEDLVEAMKEIIEEDECNNTYGSNNITSKIQTNNRNNEQSMKKFDISREQFF